MMDVLISWSKPQSHSIASVLYDWLPKVVPGLKPWMSDKDIAKGKLWFGELQSFLGEATSCIICVTAENVRSPWIYYEVGSIATKKQDVLVCPYLVGVDTNMISDGPLAQYQCTVATQDDTFSLIKSLNGALPVSHNEMLLKGNFDQLWGPYCEELSRILDMEPSNPDDFVATDADALAGYHLSSEARTLLVKAVTVGDGTVYYSQTRAGFNTEVGNETLNIPRNRRSEAVWLQAIRDLVECQLLEARSYKQEVFRVTARGYEVADVLQQKAQS